MTNMKVTLYLVLAAAFMTYVDWKAEATFGLLSGLFGGNTNSQSVRICILNNRLNCSSTTRVCARIGNTETCGRFRNGCHLQRANCQSTRYTFRRVNNSLCSNLAVNRYGPCND